MNNFIFKDNVYPADIVNEVWQILNFIQEMFLCIDLDTFILDDNRRHGMLAVFEYCTSALKQSMAKLEEGDMLLRRQARINDKS
jgi:hypothetical protein